MRILFLVLLLANLAFFAWDRYLRAPLDVRERIRQVEITPEKIRVLGPPVVTKAESEPAKAEKEAVAAKPAKEFEARWGDSDGFVRASFKSLWGHYSPDA